MASSPRPVAPPWRYNASLAHDIEVQWQAWWHANGTFETETETHVLSDSRRPAGELGENLYVLDMFPYPSGEGLHVGHPLGYIATDIYCVWVTTSLPVSSTPTTTTCLLLKRAWQVMWRSPKAMCRRSTGYIWVDLLRGSVTGGASCHGARPRSSI